VSGFQQYQLRPSTEHISQCANSNFSSYIIMSSVKNNRSITDQHVDIWDSAAPWN